jgi:hypothetical protein
MDPQMNVVPLRKKSNLTLILIAVGVGVLLIVGVVLAVILWPKKSEQSSNTSGSTKPNGSASQNVGYTGLTSQQRILQGYKFNSVSVSTNTLGVGTLLYFTFDGPFQAITTQFQNNQNPTRLQPYSEVQYPSSSEVVLSGPRDDVRKAHYKQLSPATDFSIKLYDSANTLKYEAVIRWDGNPPPPPLE